MLADGQTCHHYRHVDEAITRPPSADAFTVLTRRLGLQGCSGYGFIHYRVVWVCSRPARETRPRTVVSTAVQL